MAYLDKLLNRKIKEKSKEKKREQYLGHPAQPAARARVPDRYELINELIDRMIQGR
jgi:hypothetical protein